jgi:hypothetical protein
MTKREKCIQRIVTILSGLTGELAEEVARDFTKLNDETVVLVLHELEHLWHELERLRRKESKQGGMT